MRMKSAAAAVLSLVLAGAALTGCAETSEPRQEAPQETVVDEVETTLAETTPAEITPAETTPAETQPAATEAVETVPSETGSQSTAGYEDNFAVDSKAAKEFAQKVQAAAAAKDLEALADLTAFPVYVGLPDVGVVNTREDFLNLGAETVFTEALLQSVENADIGNFQPSMAGFSISDGGAANINFGVTDGVLAINGINYGVLYD